MNTILDNVFETSYLMMKFRPGYLIIAAVLFVTEVCIAAFVHDRIIRPYIGDVLVVMLIYSFLRAFLNLPVWVLALFTLLFAYMIETLQYFNIAELLGLDPSGIATIVIGNSFAWIDVWCYTLGIMIVLMTEKIVSFKKNATHANPKHT